MAMLEILGGLVLIVGLIVGIPVAYLFIIACSAVVMATRRARREASGAGQPTTRTRNPLPHFAVLVPAHDEEEMIASTLESLSRLDYPRDRYTVCVVADNCTDRTAHIARSFEGVRVYERTDPTKRGKGFALNWLLANLEGDGLIFDACVVLDADSVVNTGFIAALAREYEAGGRAMQSWNTVLNTTEAPSTVLRWIALTLVNHVRCLGRNGIGGSANLSNGLCLSREVLQKFPWQAFGLAEDYQYYLNLVEHGIRVRYVPEAVVRSHMPTTFSQMRTQDVRWEASQPGRSTAQTALALLRAAARAPHWMRLEAIFELLTPPLSLMVSAVGTICMASILLRTPAQLWLSLALCLGLAGYIGSALVLLRPPRAAYTALVHAPAFVVWKLWVVLFVKRSKARNRDWVRTSRVPTTVK